jgi:hypothetical protein
MSLPIINTPIQKKNFGSYLDSLTIGIVDCWEIGFFFEKRMTFYLNRMSSPCSKPQNITPDRDTRRLPDFKRIRIHPALRRPTSLKRVLIFLDIAKNCSFLNWNLIRAQFSFLDGHERDH